EKPLQPSNGAPLDLECHGLDRLAFQLAELTDHRVKEMSARLTADKTVVKGGLELPQFLHEPFHITGDEVKRGNGKAFAAGPTWSRRMASMLPSDGGIPPSAPRTGQVAFTTSGAPPNRICLKHSELTP